MGFNENDQPHTQLGRRRRVQCAVRREWVVIKSMARGAGEPSTASTQCSQLRIRLRKGEEREGREWIQFLVLVSGECIIVLF